VTVTVANVARRAGVSAATAARVLSGRGYASDDARRAVLEAAEEIGYVPNNIARSLRTRRTMLAGLLIGDVENSFYSVIAKNVESVAKNAGYQVVLCNSNDDAETESQYLQLLDGMRVDGLIITPTGRNQRYLRRLLEKGTVIVQIDRMVEGLNADAVLLDNEAGAMAAVSHLIAAGHSRIGILTGPRDVLTARERLEGYERALREHGIPVRPELIRDGSFLHDHAIEAATELLGSRPAPTAIFAANNVLAEGCFLALGGLGLRVPRDVSVVAFDDVPWMSMVRPQLTAIRQPVADMARSAGELLMRRLRDNGPVPSTSVFRSELVVRGSVAPIRKPRGESSS
jgi:LacI family transcriptional regulator, galactose operon repressor